MLFFNLVLAEFVNDFSDHVRYGGRDSMGGASLCDLRNRETVRNNPDFRATEADGDVHSHEPQIGHFLQVLTSELFLFVVQGGYRLDRPLRKIPDHISDHLLFGSQPEVHK